MNEQEPDFDSTSEAERAEWLYENRDSLTVEDLDREFVIAPDVSAVVSVRIPSGQLGVIESAARNAGMPLSTYIRQAALATAHAVNLEKARKDLTRIRTAVSDLERHLGAAA